MGVRLAWRWLKPRLESGQHHGFANYCVRNRYSALSRDSGANRGALDAKDDVSRKLCKLIQLRTVPVLAALAVQKQAALAGSQLRVHFPVP